MGCDIHSYAETLDEDGVTWSVVGDVFPLDEFGRKWHQKDFCNSPFDWRSYSMYAFLAGVRNYCAITPISEPRGFPITASPEVSSGYESWGCDAHSASWLLVSELLAVDYDQVVNDRRDGRDTLSEEDGTKMSLREFLDEAYFRDLDVLKSLGDPQRTRIVFWFDN